MLLLQPAPPPEAAPPGGVPAAGSPTVGGVEGVRTLLCRYGMLRFSESVCRCLADSVGAVRESLGRPAQSLDRLHSRLGRLEGQFGEGAAPQASNWAERRSRAADARGEAKPSWAEPAAEALDARLRARQTIRLAELAAADDARFESLAEMLRDEALRFLIEAGRSLLASGEASPGASPAEPAPPDSTLAPRLSGVGGRHRVLAVLPQDESPSDWTRRLAETFGDCVTVDRDPRGDLFLCCEVEGVAPEAVAAHLAAGDPQVADMASRLHTRIDVRW